MSSQLEAAEDAPGPAGHRVSAVDPSTRRGECSVCGPVSVYAGSSRQSPWRCAEAHKAAGRARYAETPRARPPSWWKRRRRARIIALRITAAYADQVTLADLRRHGVPEDMLRVVAAELAVQAERLRQRGTELAKRSASTSG